MSAEPTCCSPLIAGVWPPGRRQDTGYFTRSSGSPGCARFYSRFGYEVFGSTWYGQRRGCGGRERCADLLPVRWVHAAGVPFSVDPAGGDAPVAAAARATTTTA